MTWHGLGQLAIGIVVRGGRIGLNGDGRRQGGGKLLSSSGGWSARIRAMGGDASYGTGDQRRGCTGFSTIGQLSLDGGNVDHPCSRVGCKGGSYCRAGKYPDEGLHLREQLQ